MQLSRARFLSSDGTMYHGACGMSVAASMASRARDAMLAATDIPQAPWYIVPSDDKKRARLNCIADILSRIPYEEIPYKPPKLPPRQKPHGYEEPKLQHQHVAERY